MSKEKPRKRDWFLNKLKRDKKVEVQEVQEVQYAKVEGPQLAANHVSEFLNKYATDGKVLSDVGFSNNEGIIDIIDMLRKAYNNFNAGPNPALGITTEMLNIQFASDIGHTIEEIGIWMDENRDSCSEGQTLIINTMLGDLDDIKKELDNCFGQEYAPKPKPDESGGPTI